MSRKKASRKPIHNQHLRDIAGRSHEPGSGLTNHDAAYGHTQGGLTHWGESPLAGYMPPPASLGVLHDFVPKLAQARRIGLDFVGPDKHPGWLKALLRVPTDKGDILYFESKLALDTDAASGLRRKDATNKGSTSYWDADNNALDANRIPYFVLPKYPRDFWWAFGIRPLDIAAIIHGDKVVFAVFGDLGPPDQIGEASIEVHRELGIERVTNGKVVDRNFAEVAGAKKRHEQEAFVTTIVFPGSGSQSVTSVATVRARGRELFRAVGGAG